MTANFQMVAILMIAAADAMAQHKQDSARRIVVSLQDRKLALVENGRVVRIYATAVGAPKSPSPTGSFLIVARLEHPTWYGPKKVVPPGSANPLGTRWLGLSRKGYGIHGTNRPRSIGRNVSHGCIRMRNRDVEELFTLVEVGDAVELHAERSADLDALFGTEVAASNAPGTPLL